MKTIINLGRSLLLVGLLGLLSACGDGEPQTPSEIESHGHAHD